MEFTRKGMAYAAIFVSIAIAGISGCQKETVSESGKQAFALYLTDDPDNYDEVNIDIRFVEVKVDTTEGRRDDDDAGRGDDDQDDDRRNRDEYGRWDTLDFDAGIYDVAALRNGIDTRLATGIIDGRIRKIRITLGTGSTVVVNGISYPLVLPSDAHKYLYVKIEDEHRQWEDDEQRVWLDFDISRSIKQRNGQYFLLPVLKPFCDNKAGALSGKVLPAGIDVQVNIYGATDSATAIPEDDGRFKVRGLRPGTYSVIFDAEAPYRDTTLTGVNVDRGKAVMLPVITLTQ